MIGAGVILGLFFFNDLLSSSDVSVKTKPYFSKTNAGKYETLCFFKLFNERGYFKLIVAYF